MDKRKRIPIRDVKQIAYEVGLWAINIERISSLSKKLGEPSDVEFKDKFDNWIENRIQMVNEVEFCICGNETGSRFYDKDKKTIECVDCGKQIQN